MALSETFLSFAKRFFLSAPNTKEIAPGLGINADQLQPYQNPEKVAQEQGLSYFRDMRLKESFLKAACQIHRDISYLWVSAKGLNPTEDRALHAPQLLPADEDPLSMEIWEYCAEVLDFEIARGFKSCLKQAQQSAMTFGYAVEEVLWSKREDGKIGIADIKDRDPDMFGYNWKDGYWFQKSFYRDTSGPPISDRKFLIVTPHLYQENVYGISEFTDLVKAQYAIAQVELFAERHLEKFGSGQMYAKIPPEKCGKAHKEFQDGLLALLARLRNQGVAYIPSDIELQIIESQGAGEFFIAYLTWLADKIAVSLMGNNMVMKAPSVGSQALSENTTAVSSSKVERTDATTYCHAYDLVIEWLVDFNWGPQDKYPYLQLIDPRQMQAQEAENMDTESDEEQDDTEEMTGDEKQKPAKKKEKQKEEQEIIQVYQETPRKTPRRTIPAIHNPERPDIFQDPFVQAQALAFMQSQPVLTRQLFDRLPKDEQGTAFTITALLRDGGAIRDLHAILQGTLREADEGKAWVDYQAQAADLFVLHGISYVDLKDLEVSFRYARQKALNMGIKAFVEANADTIYGLMYMTQDDPWVRFNHDRMHGVVRPIDDPVWKIWWPPSGFNCRCWIQPITYLEYEQAPEDYKYTRNLPTVWPDRGFGESPL